MAYPTVAAKANSTTDTASTSHSVSLPANIDEGDLLLIFIATDGGNTISNWNGFSELANGSRDTHCSLSIGYKWASGSEGASITITTANSEHASHMSWRITGADSEQNPEVSSVATGADSYPNASSLAPTGGAKDYLWIVVEGNDAVDTAIVFPLSDNNLGQDSGGGSTDGCSLGICSDDLNQSSLDPDAFTIEGDDQWVAFTVVVHPGEGSEGSVVPIILNQRRRLNA